MARGSIRIGRAAPVLFDDEAGYPGISVQAPSFSFEIVVNNQKTVFNVQQFNERSRVTTLDPHTAADYSAYRAAHFNAYKDG